MTFFFFLFFFFFSDFLKRFLFTIEVTYNKKIFLKNKIKKKK